jgi:hypothetical protein
VSLIERRLRVFVAAQVDKHGAQIAPCVGGAPVPGSESRLEHSDGLFEQRTGFLEIVELVERQREPHLCRGAFGMARPKYLEPDAQCLPVSQLGALPVLGYQHQ